LFYFCFIFVSILVEYMAPEVITLGVRCKEGRRKVWRRAEGAAISPSKPLEGDSIPALVPTKNDEGDCTPCTPVSDVPGKYLLKFYLRAQLFPFATVISLEFFFVYFSVEYMAPEVVTRSPGYSKPADWWSFGIFTFDLLTGRSPFHSNRGKQETKERILRGKFHTPAFLTPQAQDMIRRLLRRPVDRRLGSKDGAIEIKSHEFFAGICWDKVLKRDYEPPFVPILSSEDDVSNFDTRFTSKSPRESDDMGGRNGNNSAQGMLKHQFGIFLV
jgi:serine/threonine protein kinase